MNQEEIVKIVEKYKNERGSLIAILEDIQTKYSYLPQDALRIVADKTGRSLVDIYGVATFYRAFSLKPRGKHLACVCVGTACHVRGAERIASEFERQLHVSAGETTADKEFTLETVNCLGACALGPIVTVDGHYFSNVGPQKVKQIVENVRKGQDEFKEEGRVFPVEVRCPCCNHSLMDPDHFVDLNPSIRLTISFERKHGWIRLSSLYGSFNIESEYEIPMDTIIHFFCPHCHAELVGASNCTDCGAPMVPMMVRGGGMVQICSRRGCKSHMLDLADIYE